MEGTFALESVMDELAATLGLDPLEVRLRNYAGNNQTTGLPYSTKRLREAYERGASLIGWKERKKGETGFRRKGWGMSSQIWGGSGGPPAYALVKVNPDGSATVISGTRTWGRVRRPSWPRLPPKNWGFPWKRFPSRSADTELCPFAPLSAGSMTVPSVGPAVRFAAHDAREQILEIAAQALEVPRDSLMIREGMLESPELKNPVPLKDILSDLRNFMIVGRGGRAPNPEEAHVNTFGAQFVELEVDTADGGGED